MEGVAIVINWTGGRESRGNNANKYRKMTVSGLTEKKDYSSKFGKD